MTTAPAQGRSILMASLTAVLVLTDCGLTALGWTVWNAYRHGDYTGPEVATFALFGASAVLGAVVLLAALIALARGTAGHAAARFASGLAWLRLAGVLIALAVIVIRFGASGIAGLLQTFGAAVALVDAFIAVIVAGAAVRRTHHG